MIDISTRVARDYNSLSGKNENGLVCCRVHNLQVFPFFMECNSVVVNAESCYKIISGSLLLWQLRKTISHKVTRKMVSYCLPN